jgi:hypothetical protein
LRAGHPTGCESQGSGERDERLIIIGHGRDDRPSAVLRQRGAVSSRMPRILLPSAMPPPIPLEDVGFHVIGPREIRAKMFAFPLGEFDA